MATVHATGVVSPTTRRSLGPAIEAAAGIPEHQLSPEQVELGEPRAVRLETAPPSRMRKGWNITKTVAMLAIPLFLFMPWRVGIGLVVVAGAVKLLGDAITLKEAANKEPSFDGEKPWLERIGDIMTLFTVVLLLLPSSVTMGVIGIATLVHILMIRRLNRQGVAMDENPAIGQQALSETKKQSYRWLVYVVESIAGYAAIMMVYHCCKMNFAASPQLSLLSAGIHGAICWINVSIARKIEGEILGGEDVDESALQNTITKKLGMSPPFKKMRSWLQGAMDQVRGAAAAAAPAEVGDEDLEVQPLVAPAALGTIRSEKHIDEAGGVK